MAAKLRSESLSPGPDEVIIRMYRIGLGDCFLIAVGAEKKPKYVLIDCGIHRLQANGGDRMLKVSQHAVETVKSHFDVVVATHQHADHLSGFVQKESPFLSDAVKIDQLWLAWTENPRSPQARELRRKHGTARAVVRKAAEELRKATKNVEFAGPSAQLAIRALSKRVDNLENGFEVPAKEIVDDKQVKFISQKIDELLKSHPEKKAQSWTDSEFASQGHGISLSEGEQKPSANEVALELLAMKAREVHYCNPGDLLEIPDVPANLIHAWVLGPPRDELRLKKDKPSKIRGEEAFKEVYLSSSVQSSALARSPALNSSGEMGSVSRPFDNVAESTPLKPFESNEAGMNVVLADDDPATDLLSQLYFDPAAEWRRIDADWLRGIEPLALDLDSDTNNTSLVLAFELGSLGKGKVLLFPGDAQVGNWLSWRDQKYEFENVEISADDLLKRTTLYKCGHHGSHNATVKRDPGDAIEHPEGAPFGLELMNDIITMIPVHRKSSDKARGWDMPYKKLYEKIREKSFNRVLRSDLSMEPLEEASLPDIVPKSEAFERIPGMPSRFEWRKSEETFEDDKSPLYFDVKIRVNKSEQEP